MNSLKKQIRLTKIMMLLAFLLAVWVAIHLPAIWYGTENLPLHMSYIGDEQSPVNGALHVLQDKNLLAFRNLKTVYYGPLFPIISLPAVVLDFGEKFISGRIQNSNQYKNYILWNWGGIAWKNRVIATIFSFAVIILVFMLCNTRTLNPSGSKKIPIFTCGLLATNFLFFEYASFFRHWVFVLFSLVGLIYCLVRLYESHENKYQIYCVIFSLFGFGISYLSLIFQIIWLPLLIIWFKGKKYKELRFFAFSSVLLLVGVALIVMWHPHAFFRIIGLTGGDIINTDTSNFSSEKSSAGLSFAYYFKILFNNELPLLITIGGLTLYLSLKKRIYKEYWFQILLLPAVAVYLIFGAMGHHESRYILPVMVLLIIYLGALLVSYFQDKNIKNRLITVSIIIFISFSFLYNTFIDIMSSRILLQGHKEEKLIREIKQIQTKEPSSKTLLVKYYLLGAPHTKDAYWDYMNKTNKTKVNLYNELLKTPLPEGIASLSVEYSIPIYFKLNKEIIKKYNHIIYYYEIAPEQKPEPDYFDVNALNLLYHKSLSDSYFFIK